jgi:hypothetical protein
MFFVNLIIESDIMIFMGNLLILKKKPCKYDRINDNYK